MPKPLGFGRRDGMFTFAGIEVSELNPERWRFDQRHQFLKFVSRGADPRAEPWIALPEVNGSMAKELGRIQAELDAEFLEKAKSAIFGSAG